VLFTKEDMPPCRVPIPVVQKMEDAFVQFRLLERDDLYKCIGGGIVPQNRDARGWNKLRRDLKKTFDSFYKEFDAHPAPRPDTTPPISKPSASQKSEPEK
jgi:hypothetical protein